MFKIKIRKADSLFSTFVRKRDKWQCQRCKKIHKEGSRTLVCSHYWGRGKEGTRFEPDNCDALCGLPCHDIWGHGDERDIYKEFKIKQLGEKRFNEVMLQAHTYKKRDDVLDKLYVEQLLSEL